MIWGADWITDCIYTYVLTSHHCCSSGASMSSSSHGVKKHEHWSWKWLCCRSSGCRLRAAEQYEFQRWVFSSGCLHWQIHLHHLHLFTVKFLQAHQSFLSILSKASIADWLQSLRPVGQCIYWHVRVIRFYGKWWYLMMSGFFFCDRYHRLHKYLPHLISDMFWWIEMGLNSRKPHKHSTCVTSQQIRIFTSAFLISVEFLFIRHNSA